MKKKDYHFLLGLLLMLLQPVHGKAQLREGPQPLSPQQQLAPGLRTLRPSTFLDDNINREQAAFRVVRQLRQRSVRQQGPLRVLADGTTLWGNVISSQNLPTGAYSFQAVSDIPFEPLKTGITRANGGGAFADGKLYMVNYTYYASWNLLWGDVKVYDTDTWVSDSKSRSIGSSNAAMLALDADYDPTTGKFYGCTYTNDMKGYQITELDYENAIPTQVAATDSVYVGIAIDGGGQMYGISLRGYLCKIDKTSGEPTLVGYTGMKPGPYNQSAAFDRESGKIYWCAVDENQQSAFYEVDATTGSATKICDMPGNEQLTCLYVPASGQKGGAPSIAENLTADFDGNSTTGTVRFTIPTVTFNDQPLQGSVDYTIAADGLTVKTGTAEAGADVEEMVTVEGGMTTISVVLENAEGTSPVRKLTQWIGYDAPNAVEWVSFEVDQESQQATVSWAETQGSVHGGTIEEDKISYDVVRYPDNVVVATGVKGTTYVDNIPFEGMKPYRYGVIAFHNGVKGGETVSEAVVVGQAIEPPYNETFENRDGYDLFTIVDANEDGRTFRYFESSNYKCVQSPDSWRAASDDYMLLPPVHLKADRTYKLFFRSRCYSGYDNKETMEVLIGQGDDYTTFSTLMPQFDLPYNTPEFLILPYEKVFRVDAEGNYRIAFHDVSEYDNDRFELHQISITEEALNSAPDAVADLKAVADDHGQLEATISFTTPTKSIDGAALAAIEKVEVYRGETLVSTLSEVAPGVKQEVVDSHADDGFNTYTVKAYNESGAGLSASVKVFVGTDQPLPPTNARLADDNDKPKATWDAPAGGVNGGYVNVDALTYNIYTADNNGYAVPYKENITGTTFTADTTFAEPGLLIYAVAAANEKGISTMASTNTIVVGPAYELPFAESFAGSKLNTFWWFEEHNSQTGLADGSADEDSGDLLWQSQNSDAWGIWGTGKLAMAGTTNPHLLFYCYNVAGSNTKVTVIATKPSNEQVTLHTIDMAQKTASGWVLNDVDLSPVKNERYIVLNFRFEGSDTQNATAIDNVRVYDKLEYDLSATLTAPSRTVAGTNTSFAVNVTNWGVKRVSSYRVDLYDGNQLVASADGSGISSLKSQTITLHYQPAITNDSEQLDMHAEVVLDEDMDLSNNQTEVSVVEVMQPEMDPVENAMASKANDGSVVISWTAPKNEVKATTDDMENYEPWTVNNFGEWTSIENDGATHYSLSGITIRNNRPTTAFEIFGLQASGADINDPSYAFLAPHSGDRTIIALGGADGYYPDADKQHDDDWLISPELSGRAQTVSFFLKTMSSWKKEKVEILYSTATTDLSDFQSLALYEDLFTERQWTEYNVELPEGARYFAVRKLSFDATGIMLDDFTFEHAPFVLTGYNIYRDGQLIGQVGTDELSFTDTEAAADGVYAITAVYTVGESMAVFVTPVTTGIDITASATQDRGASVYSADGRLVKRQATGLGGLQRGVYIINGKKVVR